MKPTKMIVQEQTSLRQLITLSNGNMWKLNEAYSDERYRKFRGYIDREVCMNRNTFYSLQRKLKTIGPVCKNKDIFQNA